MNIFTCCFTLDFHLLRFSLHYSPCRRAAIYFSFDAAPADMPAEHMRDACARVMRRLRYARLFSLPAPCAMIMSAWHVDAFTPPRMRTATPYMPRAMP